jgi:hypothetical protein
LTALVTDFARVADLSAVLLGGQAGAIVRLGSGHLRPQLAEQSAPPAVQYRGQFIEFNWQVHDSSGRCGQHPCYS